MDTVRRPHINVPCYRSYIEGSSDLHVPEECWNQVESDEEKVFLTRTCYATSPDVELEAPFRVQPTSGSMPRVEYDVLIDAPGSTLCSNNVCAYSGEASTYSNDMYTFLTDHSNDVGYHFQRLAGQYDRLVLMSACHSSNFSAY
jgi:hypothetical protein